MSYKSNLKLLVMLGPDLLTSIEKKPLIWSFSLYQKFDFF